MFFKDFSNCSKSLSFSTSETSVINLEKLVYEARIDGYTKSIYSVSNSN